VQVEPAGALHVSVADWPATTLVGATLIVTVNGGGGGMLLPP